MKHILIILFLLISLSGISQNIKGYEVTALKLLEAKEAFVLGGDSVYSTTKLSTEDTILVTRDYLIDSGQHVIQPFDTFAYNTSYVPTGNEGAGVTHWNSDEYTTDIITGFGPVMQVGQELWVHVFNNTLDTMDDGSVVYPIGTATGALPNIGLAIANSFETIQFQVGMLTHSIPPNSDGFVVIVGTVRDIDITGLSFGPVYISTTVAGGLTTTKPEFPNYDILMGVVTKTGSEGAIVVDIRGGVENTFTNFWNGVFRESFDFRVVSDGTTIKGYIEPANGHPDMTMVFSDGFTTLPTTPADTIILIAGTDTVARENYVYIPEATKVLTVSTSDYPAEEHIKVAHVSLASAATAVLEKGLMNQNINDPVENTNTFQGHLSHITDKIRQGYADWKSGCEGSSTTGANIYFSATGGVVYQMHRQTVEALSMPTENVHIMNDFLHSGRRVTDLVTYQDNALGNTMNNSSFSIVFYIMANKTGEPSHLMCNYPTGGYSKNFPEQAVADGLNYSVYDIPTAYKSAGFLVARCTYIISGGVWTLYETEDLRGKVPNTTAGGGAGGGQGATTYLGLTDTPAEFIALAFQRANSAGTALENVLAGAIQLTEFDSTGFTVDTTQVVGLDVFRTDINTNATNLSNHGLSAVTAIDATTADAITTGGVTITNNNSINRGTLDGVLQIFGGNSFNAGAVIAVYGESHPSSAGNAILTYGGTPGTGDLNSTFNVGYRNDAGARLEAFSIDKNLDATFTGTASFADGILVGDGATVGQLTGGTENIDGLTVSYNGDDLLGVISDSVTTAKISSVTFASDTLTIVEGVSTFEVEIAAGGFNISTQSLTETAGVVSWDVTNGSGAIVTIDEPTVITISNLADGQECTIKIIQGDADDDNVTFIHAGLTVEWRGDDDDLTDASAAKDLVSLKRMSSFLETTLGTNYVTQ